MSSAIQAYKQTTINTIGQGELLIMLYDGAIKFLHQAREKILEKDYAKKGILISKVIDIVNELSSSLNMEKGGEIAKNLNNLYFFCTTHLLQANLKMDVDKLDNVINILSELRGAYAEIIERPEAILAAQQISARMAPSLNASNRNSFSTQNNVAANFSGQKQGHSVYGQYAQKSSYASPQVSAENYDAVPATQPKNALADNSNSSTIGNMGASLPPEQISNTATLGNTEAHPPALKNEQSNAQIQSSAVKEDSILKEAQLSNSAPKTNTDSNAAINALSKKPLSSLSARVSKRMSLYGKVGQ